MIAIDAKTRFKETAKAVNRLNEIKWLLMYNGDDWKPESVKAAHETSDPTALKAIYNVDELADKLTALRQEERELEQFIGESLAIISAVRDGFGEIYASLLDWRYIERWTWKRIYSDYGIPKSTGHYLLNIAFDWIDSIGVSRLLRGQVDL